MRTFVMAAIYEARARGVRGGLLAPEREAAFLAPLAVERLFGVGAATAAKLRAHGLATVGADVEPA